ncbi:MAG: hypothetical protein PSX36_13825 [bacterium]|nr:hypothetical protein [bacterium]
MKKAALILFALYFLVSSVGVLYETHTCGTTQTSSIWGLPADHVKACTCNHEAERAHKKKCCKNTSQWFKAGVESTTLKGYVKSLKFELAAICWFRTYYVTSESFKEDAFLAYEVSHSPPISKNPHFITFRSLLI